MAFGYYDTQEPYSTLEYNRFEPDAQAPEHDLTRSAPEVNRTLNIAPEVAPSTDPQAHYSQTLPEAVSDPSVQEHYQPEKAIPAATSAGHGGSRKRWFVIGAVIGILVLAVALGVGLGVGLKKNSSNATPEVSISTIAASSSTATTSPQATSTAGSAPSQANAILNDTSLASATLSDGTRRVFFQDNTSSIRQAIYSDTSKEWTASNSFVVVKNAKQNSPMSAFVVPASISQDEEIHLFYISQNNSINFVIWETRSASWSNDTSTYANVEEFQVRPDSRSFSAVFRQNQTSNDLQESKGNAAGGIGQKYPALRSQNLTTYLMFESSTGDVVWKLGFWGFTATTDSSESAWNWVWMDLDLKDKVAASYAILVENGSPLPSLAPPFVNAIAPAKELGSAYDVEIFSIATPDNDNGTGYQYWKQAYEDEDSGPSTAGFSISGIPVDLDTIDFSRGLVTTPGNTSTGITWGFWVNGTDLAQLDVLGSEFRPSQAPQTTFPFTRLASDSPGNSTAINLYHQLNETSIASDVYDTAAGVWDSTVFTVGTT